MNKKTLSTIKKMINLGATARQIMILCMISSIPLMLRTLEIESKELEMATYIIAIITLILASVQSILPATLLFFIATNLIVIHFFMPIPGLFITGCTGLAMVSLIVFTFSWRITGKFKI